MLEEDVVQLHNALRPLGPHIDLRARPERVAPLRRPRLRQAQLNLRLRPIHKLLDNPKNNRHEACQPLVPHCQLR
jgi:hypothetical protein